ncbi:MAG: NAD(P)H-quinone oxidoreductase [Myxococcota bacterium]
MRAVIITTPGGADVLEIGELADPSPGPGQVLVKVAATGLNRADIIQRRGFYPAPPGFPDQIPGLEYAGEVIAVGSDTRLRKVGDRVMGLIGGGACAELLAVHERETIAIPEGISTVDAAAIPEVFITAYDAAHLQADLRMGQNILIHAIGSGVGTAALQLAACVGARTFGTTRSKWKLDRCAELELGLDVGIHTSESPKFQEILQEYGGADVILDLVGGGYLERNIEALRYGGHMIIVGLLTGTQATLPMGTVLRRRLTITGTALRARPLEEKIALAQLFEQRIVPLFERGKLRPLIDRTFSMDEIQAAHTFMEENANFGKILLAW